jgi:predicted amidohydrolase YtcJ
VTRFSRGGCDTVLEAIRMFTAWSAYGANEEHEKGHTASGLPADFVVLHDDPFSVPISEIGTIEVDRTIVGGRTISSAS